MVVECATSIVAEKSRWIPHDSGKSFATHASRADYYSARGTGHMVSTVGDICPDFHRLLLDFRNGTEAIFETLVGWRVDISYYKWNLSSSRIFRNPTPTCERLSVPSFGSQLSLKTQISQGTFVI